MSPEIKTILMSGIAGAVVALIGALLRHGSRLWRGQDTPLAQVIPPAPKSGKRDQHENPIIQSLNLRIIVLIVMALGVMILVAVGGNPGEQSLARAVMIMFIPALVAFIVVRLILEQLIIQIVSARQEN
jgi:hypothetical protein